MPSRVRTPLPPTGLRRWALRLPILLFRLHLDRLLGERIALLTHTGRSTGLPRQVALEITGRDPFTGAYLLASGFGPASQWYRNVRRTPEVTLRVGGRTLAATARPLTPDESGLAMANYALRHPRTARRLMRLCGLEVDGSGRDYYLAGRDHVPFVAVRPHRP
ncbi:nitroreductase family deazaflavin-dependent oxidoreductase [Kitasatospora cineracea]|uniref:nitroreductase family deazaflavin-dependent oxidoreductase n=1 Tax=Kitasatospora cineracea TaxID=88074 RepID=UPI0037BDACB7